jgi:ABC-type Fe3+ transport system substrate-binding protein
MPDTIHPEMRIADLVAAHPETLPVFAAYGLEELVGEEALRLLAPFLTLGTALRTREIPVDKFLLSLRQHLHQTHPPEAPALHEIDTSQRLSLLGLLPCGLKVPFGKAIASFFQTNQAEANPPLTYAVEGNVNQELSYYTFVDQVESLDGLPDIIVSSDFNAFFYRRFRQRFIDQGHFVDVSQPRLHSAFDGTGILDPLGQFTLLTVNPLIIVADLERVGNRPLPRCWADLLDPMWQHSITLRGDRQFFCHAVLLPFFKEHGASAMTALARNVLRGQHPAQMVKEAGADRPDGAALYVMPDFFAHKIARQDKVRIIWPEDGGLISPVTMLVKKQRATQLKAVTDFLTGAELAKVFAGAWFPSPHPQVNNAMPPNARLKWLGWDYLRDNDLADLNAAIDAIFLPVLRAGQA